MVTTLQLELVELIDCTKDMVSRSIDLLHKDLLLNTSWKSRELISHIGEVFNYDLVVCHFTDSPPSF